MSRPLRTAPRDGTHVLLHIDGQWVEGWWQELIGSNGMAYGLPYWDVARVPSHGCGCCSYDNPEPTAWAPLPKELRK